MGKRDKKKDKQSKTKGKDKTELKTTKNEKKKAKRDLKNKGEEDIEHILASIVAKEKARVAVMEDVTGPPSFRCGCSLTAHPTKEELILFGGEYFDGEKTLLYNDLFRYNIEKNEWRCISSPNTPPPRSSHQAVTFRDWLYVFGGEFTSPSQNQFYHYKDLWRLNLSSNAWEQIQVRGGPSARSGHRMVTWKTKIVLFGGFYDTSREIKYFNDLYLFDLEELSWRKIEVGNAALWPTPRSGFQMVCFGDEVYVFGGYCKQPKDPKGDDATCVVHTDIWRLHMGPLKWEKVKRSAFVPTTRSGFGVALHGLKRRAVLFGGVHDEEDDDDMRSTFFNDMYAYQFDQHRWFPIALRQPKKQKERRERIKRPQQQHQPEKSGLQKDGEQEGGGGAEMDTENDAMDMENEESWKDFDGDGDGWDGDEVTDIADKEREAEAEAEADPQACVAPISAQASSPPSSPQRTVTSSTLPPAPLVFAPPLSASASASASTLPPGPTPNPQPSAAIDTSLNEFTPCPRFNPCLVCKGNTLYIYGGMFERSDQEITLNDFWSLDLNKLDAFNNIVPMDLSSFVWLGGDSDAQDSDSDSSDEDDDDDEEEGDDGDDEDEAEEMMEVDEEKQIPKGKKKGMANGKAEKDSLDSGASTARAAEKVAGMNIKEGGEEEQEEEEEGQKQKQRHIVNSNSNSSSTVLRKKGARNARGVHESLRAKLRQEQDDRTPRGGETLRDFFARTGDFWAREAYSITQQTGKNLRRDGFQLAEDRYKAVLPLLQELADLEKEMQEEEEEKRKEKERKNPTKSKRR